MNLENENAQLLSELKNEWEMNHAEHCGGWPHEDGEEMCCWPLTYMLRKKLEEGAIEIEPWT